MIFSVPVSLILAYALFRMCEYYASKNYQMLYAEGINAETQTPLMVFGLVLMPARFGAWALLIWLAFKIGLGATVGLVVMAFLLSVALQATLGVLLTVMLRQFVGVLFLAAVPILAVVIALLIAAL